MAQITTYLPEDLKELEPDLTRFFEAMVYKLRKNSHKGKWENMTLVDLEKLLRDEVDELSKAIIEGTNFEVILESADIGNFAMMLASVALEQRQ